MRQNQVALECSPEHPMNIHVSITVGGLDGINRGEWTDLPYRRMPILGVATPPSGTECLSSKCALHTVRRMEAGMGKKWLSSGGPLAKTSHVIPTYLHRKWEVPGSSWRSWWVTSTASAPCGLEEEDVDLVCDHLIKPAHSSQIQSA